MMLAAEKELVQFASQVKHLPLLNGNWVMSSCLFLSPLWKAVGSSCAGKSQFSKACFTTSKDFKLLAPSFNDVVYLWLGNWPALLQHESGWSPNSLTTGSQWDLCWWQIPVRGPCVDGRFWVQVRGPCLSDAYSEAVVVEKNKFLWQWRGGRLARFHAVAMLSNGSKQVSAGWSQQTVWCI